MAGGVRILHLEIVDNIRQHRPEKHKMLELVTYMSISRQENMKNESAGSYQGSRKAAATPTPAAKETM